MKTTHIVAAISLAAVLSTIAGAQGPGAFARPEIMRWGSTAAQLERTLRSQKLCTRKQLTRPIVPPFLDHVKNGQVQIDCDGFLFLGQPRWTEFVIGDDSLEMVWIMTTKEEEKDIERAMIAVYGEPSHRTREYTAFAQHGAALRFQPAEVLFYSPRIAAEAEGWFRK
jgi:hypothetical protein